MIAKNFPEIYTAVVTDDAEKFVAVMKDEREIIHKPGVVIENSYEVIEDVRTSLLRLMVEKMSYRCLYKLVEMSHMIGVHALNRIASYHPSEASLSASRPTERRVELMMSPLVRCNRGNITEEVCVEWLKAGKGFGWAVDKIDQNSSSDKWEKKLARTAFAAGTSNTLLILVKANYVSAEDALRILKTGEVGDPGWAYYTSERAMLELENIRLKELNEPGEVSKRQAHCL